MKYMEIRIAERAFQKSSDYDRQLASKWLDGYTITKSCHASIRYVCIGAGSGKKSQVLT